MDQLFRIVQSSVQLASCYNKNVVLKEVYEIKFWRCQKLKIISVQLDQLETKKLYGKSPTF